MSEQVTNNEFPEDVFSMSSEDFAKLDLSAFDGASPASEDEETITAPVEEEESHEKISEESDETGPAEQSEDFTNEEEETDSDERSELIEEQLEEDTDIETEQDDSEVSESVDYEAEYNKLLSPFTANGKEMQVKSVEEAHQLMKMGAGFAKKMQALKPNLKLMKMLEKNELLDEGKLSHLIDLSKKNPDAINKLIKDSGIDVLDIDTSKADGYTPGNYAVTDQQYEVDSIVDEIKDTPNFHSTAEIVSTKWDETSRNVIANNPQYLRIINEHVHNGIFDQVTAEVDRQRMFGHLQGVSDLDAYKAVGDQIHARGGFVSGRTTPTTAKVTGAPKTSKPTKQAVKEKKRAASPTKAKPATQKRIPDFNPLSLSAEEFAQLDLSQFM